MSNPNAAQSSAGTDLMMQIESLVKGAEEFKAKHGSCRVTVGPNAPIARAQIERIAGFWVDVEEVTVMRSSGDDLVIDGMLVYYRAAEHAGVTAHDIAGAVDWMGSMDAIEFHCADWSNVETSGAVHLEGRMSDNRLVDATFVLREFSVRPDDDSFDDDDSDTGDDDDE
jgi:hypothetical protein